MLYYLGRFGYCTNGSIFRYLVVVVVASQYYYLSWREIHMICITTDCHCCFLLNGKWYTRGITGFFCHKNVLLMARHFEKSKKKLSMTSSYVWHMNIGRTLWAGKFKLNTDDGDHSLFIVNDSNSQFSLVFISQPFSITYWP